MIDGGTASCLLCQSPRTEFTMHILWIIIIGFVAGIIARFLAPGPNNPAGFILTTLLGIAGAFVATLIGQTIGWYSGGRVPALAVHRERNCSSSCHWLGAEGMAQVVMPSSFLHKRLARSFMRVAPPHRERPSLASTASGQSRHFLFWRSGN
jgi:uncharacterized membrane protein YeaQ/YmgE (transglycosylase-associated protein family)